MKETKTVFKTTTKKEEEMKKSVKLAFGAVALTVLAGCSGGSYYEKMQKQTLEMRQQTYEDCKENEASLRANLKQDGYKTGDPCYYARQYHTFKPE